MSKVLSFVRPSQMSPVYRAASAIRVNLRPHQYADACALLRAICNQAEELQVSNEDVSYRTTEIQDASHVRMGVPPALTLIK